MTGLISVDEARRLIATSCLHNQTQTLTLADANGVQLARDIIARVDRPPQSVSAMDGYAVRFVDACQDNPVFQVIGAAPAGQPFIGSVGAGQAVRIFTGGVIPQGADHIIIQEDMQVEGEHCVPRTKASAPQYVRERGLDFSVGDVLLPAGTRLGPAELGLIAAANHATVETVRPLRVGLLANGDELAPPGSVLAEGHIINSNPYALAPLIETWGGVAVDLGIAGDSVSAIQAVIETASDIDVFVPIGGASVGDHDYMRPAFAMAGFTSVFEKIAVRPGKPTWFGERSVQRVLGLPGNPASAYVCAYLFLAPLLGVDVEAMTITAQLQAPLRANGPREHFMRALAAIDPTGQVVIKTAANQDSSLLKPFSECNALLRRRPNAVALESGALVDAVLMQPLRRL